MAFAIVKNQIINCFYEVVLLFGIFNQTDWYCCSLDEYVDSLGH